MGKPFGERNRTRDSKSESESEREKAREKERKERERPSKMCDKAAYVNNIKYFDM